MMMLFLVVVHNRDMSTQHIYASSNLRRIAYDVTQSGSESVGGSSEIDSTGTIPVTMDLIRSYMTRMNTMMKQLFTTKSVEEKSNIVLRINVMRQELSILTGIPFVTIQSTITTNIDE